MEGNREPPKLGSAGAPPACCRSVADPISPYVNLPNLVVLYRSNSTSIIDEIRLKNLTPRAPRLSSYSTSSEPTQIDPPPDFLLTLHSTDGPISYRFRDKLRFQSKIAKFSHPRCI